VWSANDVAKAYQSRWYIEILFKSWKSHLQIKNVIPEKYINEIRAEYLFYSSLLMINVLVHPFFLKVSERTSKENKYVSIIKICDFVSKNMSAFLRENNMEALIDSARYFCLYDSRNDRINSIQLLLLS